MNMRKNDILARLKVWIPSGFIITALFLFVYIAEQHSLRLGANDQVVQIATDVSNALGQGAPYVSFNSPRPVNIAASLSPYVIIFDADEKMMAGSAVLGGEVPRPPKGIFAYVKAHGEERVTWEPLPGVRVALYGVYHTGVNPGYIFAGRSLSETEKHIDTLTRITLAAWALTMMAAFALSLIF